ncbi:MAG: BspA family leucine-rich repeat surface protein [Lacticaseibacillus songhuajiangensis]|nr:BspA family leucine-rich repeat surface protein [Lacticaseibacillus songhuajiangensis]
MQHSMINVKQKIGWVVLALVALFFAISIGARTHDVRAATFNTAAYNAASQKGTWYGTTGPQTSAALGARVYLDNAGTLHFDSSSGPLSQNTVSASFNLTGIKDQVTGISFEGATGMIDASKGFFQNFTNLQTVTGLENVDVSKMTNMSYMFASLVSNSDNTTTSTNAKITTLSGLSSWDTSNVTTMAYMFQKQPLLKSVAGVSKWNTANVTNMNHMFYDDQSLSSIESLSAWDVSKVTDFQYAFAYLDKVTSIAGLDNWQPKSATDFSFMFAEDPLLANLNTLNWSTGSSTTFASMFADDLALTKLDLSSWNVSQSVDFSMMFYQNAGLTSLNLTGWQPVVGEDFGSMFKGDKKLTSLPGISNWVLANATNLTSMFQGMTSITDLPVAKWQLNSRGNTNITNIFWGDDALTDIDVSGWTVKDSYDASDKVFPTYSYIGTNQSQLKTITFGSNWTGKVVLPQFLLSAGTYGAWRGVTHDKANVTGAGTKTETYAPPTLAANRVETFRFAYDIVAKLVNSEGTAMPLANVSLTVTDTSGKVVLTGSTGADGTVRLPLNVTTGTYTVTLGELPGGYSAAVDTATAKIDGADANVTLVVDEQNDADLVSQYPNAGGRGTLLTIVAGVLLTLIGAAGIVLKRFTL